MAGSNIPDGVRRFLLGAVPSVPHLEALLLLHASPAQEWHPASLASRLYIGVDAAKPLLDDLVVLGLAARMHDSVRYAPRDADIAAVVDQLAGVYARHVVEVAELIHSSSDPKARRFADAFRLRREP